MVLATFRALSGSQVWWSDVVDQTDLFGGCRVLMSYSVVSYTVNLTWQV
jgi:hypothetical protein